MVKALALGALLIGINYNWWHLATVSEKQCKAEGSHRTQGQWFLPSYDRAPVRSAVRAQLQAMRRAGFATVRTLVFFYRSTDAQDDSFSSLDGRISKADRAKLAAYVRDVAAAGFSSLEIVPSFQAENWLYCRQKTWGDCFDAKRTDENWRFVHDVAATVVAARGPLALRFDLANEAAPDPRMPAATLQQAKSYLTTIAGRFVAAFPNAAWTVSMARSDGSNATETSDRLELLLSDLGEAKLAPSFLEPHVYSNDGNDLKQSLDETSAIARRIDAGIVLGELAYGSAVQASTIKAWVRAHPDSRLLAAIVWPEIDPEIPCRIDPQPPYAPGPFAP